MRPFSVKVFICLILSITTSQIFAQEPSALVDFESTTQGVLFPRMTNEQIESISNPATGLMVFSTDDQCLHIFDGANWLVNCGLNYASSSAFAPSTYNWKQISPFPGIERMAAVAFVIDDVAYVGTGLESEYLSDFYAYDLTSKTWSPIADFPGSERMEAISFSIGGKGYVGTGDSWGTFEKDVYCYNPTTNSWSQVADFPGTARFAATAFVIDDIAYVGTGFDNAFNNKQDFYSYDPTSNTWAAIADFPGSGRFDAVAFSIGGKGYVGTGDTGGTSETDFYSYDPTTNTWAAIADMPGLGKYGSVAFTLGNLGFVGVGTDVQNSKDFYIYDPISDTWDTAPQFIGLGIFGSTAFSWNGNGFVGTGLNTGGYSSSFYSLCPDEYFQITNSNGETKWSLGKGLGQVLLVDKSAGNERITNLANPVFAQDAATKAYVDANDNINDADSDPTNELNTGISLSGTMLTVTDAGGNKSVNLASLQDGTGTDDQSLTEVLTSGNSAGNMKITNLAAPTSDNDAATKAYVDANGGGSGGGTIQPTDSNSRNIRATNEGTVVGNSRGENSVDLQVQRGNADQVASGNGSAIVAGKNNKSEGDNAATLGGMGLIARSFSETVVGLFNESITPQSITAHNSQDQAFVVGVGTSDVARANALVVEKSGEIGMGTNDPNAKLHVVGDIKIVDGTQGANKVLTSNADGLASWQSLPVDNVDDADNDPTNELDNTDEQDLSLEGNILSITNDPTGNVDLSPYLDNTDNQSLSNVLGVGNDAGGMKITNLMDPSSAQDAATKAYVDANDSVDDADNDPTNELDNTDEQDLSLDGNILSITNDPTGNVDLSPYLDNTDNQSLSNVLGVGNDAGGMKITNLMDPSSAQDAATKAYVDASSGGGSGGTVQGTGSNSMNIRATNEGTIGGNARGEGSIDLQTSRTAANQVASGLRSAIVGGKNNTATGVNSFALGGESNSSNGESSGIIGGSESISSGTNSGILGGNFNFSTGLSSVVVGGEANESSEAQSGILGGLFNYTDGIGSAIIGGIFNSTSGEYSTISGGDNNTTIGDNSSILGGSNNITNGENSTTIGGIGLISNSYSETVVGLFNENIGAQSSTSHNVLDQAFVVGVGSSISSRQNALVVEKSGEVGIGTNDPTAKLHVNGTVNLQGGNVMVDGNTLMIDATANKVGIGTSMPMEALDLVGAFRLADLGSVPTASAGHSGLYSSSGELVAYDAAGNSTVISPHRFELIEKSEDMAWSYYSANGNANLVINVDMMKLVRWVEKITGEKLIFMSDLEGNPIPQKELQGELQQLRDENQALKERLEKIETMLSLKN